MNQKCSNCPMIGRFPLCAGQEEPEMCELGDCRELVSASRLLSSLQADYPRGWDKVTPINPAGPPGSFYSSLPASGGGYQVSATSTPLPSVAESLEDLAKIKACPNWSKPECGCQGGGKCALGKGKAGVVTFADCRECLAKGDNAEVKTMSFEGGSIGRVHNISSIGKGFDLRQFYGK